MHRDAYAYKTCAKRKYGLGNFLVDLIMTGVTGGCWLIWIFVREMRSR